MKFQKNYQPTERVQLTFPDSTMTKQSFKDECDINNIMKKYEKNGLIDHLNNTRGEYGDFIGFSDYQTSLNEIKAADEAFATIPAAIRARFNNNPSEFLEFVQDEKNADEMIRLGLANGPDKTAIPQEVEDQAAAPEEAASEPG